MQELGQDHAVQELGRDRAVQELGQDHSGVWRLSVGLSTRCCARTLGMMACHQTAK